MNAPFILLLPVLLFPPQLCGQDLTQEMVNSVSADSLMLTVRALENFGTRDESSPQRDSAAEYLLQRFSRLGLQSESDWYTWGDVRLTDIVVLGSDTLLMAGSLTNIFSSTDGGKHWVTVSTPHQRGGADILGMAFANAQTGCAVGELGTILRTTDGGKHWHDISLASSESLLDIEFVSDSVGFITGRTGTLRTTDCGAQWVQCSEAIPGYAIEALNESDIWVASDLGALQHSRDKGATWQSISVGLSSSTNLWGIAFSTPLRGWAVGGGADGAVIITTTDGGLSWGQGPRLADANRSLRSICFSDSMHGWIIDIAGKIFRTLDGGVHWQMTYDHGGAGWFEVFYGIKPIDNLGLWAYGGKGNLLSSSDGGQTWVSRTMDLPSSFIHSSRNIVASLHGMTSPEQECVLVAHYDSRSSSPGANDNASGTSAVLEAARIARNYRFRTTLKFVAVSAEEGGLIGSTHFAGHCRREQRNVIGAVNADMIGYATPPDTTRMIVSCVAVNHLIDTALAANQRYGLGLDLSTGLDGGLSGSDHMSFSTAGYFAIAIHEDAYYPYYHSPQDVSSNLRPDLVRRGAQLLLAVAANLAGQLDRVVPVQSEKAEIPDHFALEQNYPNPFNPKTVVSSQLPVASNVKLVIYDLLGREVAVLVNERRAAGSYQDTFDGSGLASGTYIYRMTAGSSVQSRKMMVLK